MYRFEGGLANTSCSLVELRSNPMLNRAWMSWKWAHPDVSNKYDICNESCLKPRLNYHSALNNLRLVSVESPKKSGLSRTFEGSEPSSHQPFEPATSAV